MNGYRTPSFLVIGWAGGLPGLAAKFAVIENLWETDVFPWTRCLCLRMWCGSLASIYAWLEIAVKLIWTNGL